MNSLERARGRGILIEFPNPGGDISPQLAALILMSLAAIVASIARVAQAAAYLEGWTTASIPALTILVFPEPLRMIPDDKATEEVAAYLATAPSPVYPSDVAEALRLPFDQVERAFEKLAQEGLITHG